MKKLIISFFMFSVLLGCANQGANQETENETIKVQNADEALERLKEGNARFVADDSQQRNINSAKRKELKGGQHPYAIVIACSDSRVSPIHVFNAGLGEIFEIRLAGNVVDVDVLGSIEYGVEHLKTPLIVVMGHEDCGAVTAEYDKVKEHIESEGNIQELIDKIEPSVIESTTIDEAIKKNVDYVLEQIKQDDFIHSLVESGNVKVVGAYYHLNGKVDFK